MKKADLKFSTVFAGLLLLAAFLCGCLPKESVELRPGVRWEYVDYTHSKLIFDNGEVLGPADNISLRIRDDCIFGEYHDDEGNTSFFVFEFKGRKLRRNLDVFETAKYISAKDVSVFSGLYNQVEILGNLKSPEKVERLLRGEPNEESK